MKKLRFKFKSVRITEGDWNVIAEIPGAEPITITGFTSKADADDWMNGNRKITWLRSQGLAK